MKLSPSQKDQTHHHEFILAGRRLRIRFDRWDLEDGEVHATVHVENPVVEPEDPAGFNVGGVCVYEDPEAVKETNDFRDTIALHTGTRIPRVKLGDVDDQGHHIGEVAELCAALGLNPDDSAHYHEVALAVRSAALSLARMINENEATRRNPAASGKRKSLQQNQANRNAVSKSQRRRS